MVGWWDGGMLGLSEGRTVGVVKMAACLLGVPPREARANQIPLFSCGKVQPMLLLRLDQHALRVIPF